MSPHTPVAVALACLVSIAGPAPEAADGGLDYRRIAALQRVEEIAISPDGGRIAYVVSVPRKPGTDDDGRAWRELRTVAIDAPGSTPFVHGSVSVSKVAFTPDGRYITYLAKRGDDEHRALWAIPVGGGESFRVVEHDSNLIEYAVGPAQERVAYVATVPESDAVKKAKEKGYDQQVYEEDGRRRAVWIAPLRLEPEPVGDPAADTGDPESEADATPRELGIEGAAFEIDWSPDGKRMAVTIAPSPRIDDSYMERRVTVIDTETGAVRTRFDNPGKLGRFRFGPDGAHVAMITAADWNDPREGRLWVGHVGDGRLRDLLPDLRGHVRAIAWKDASTVSYVADVGVETVLGEISLDASRSRIRLRSESGGRTPLLTDLVVSRDGNTVALIGETPRHPREVWALRAGETRPRRLTEVNPWLDTVALGDQEVFAWTARDGIELQGILIRPLERTAGRAPLLLMVHGGPESHDRNGWVTAYSRPGQLAAAEGYAVLYPNYRGSTGRGVGFSKLSQGDAAGREFDDLVDAVDALVERGVADRSRVGVTGGSYGGYATAWCATRYHERFRAGVMFVGISNKISKGLTTEIPNEDRAVHTLFDPWTRWQFSLERSPIYHAAGSETALLIAGGTDDTRVDPSQSLQLYRALKMAGKAPVRYVRYPGEKHGNRDAASRDDYTRRLMRWMNTFVRDGGRTPPPWELEIPALAEAEDEDDDEPAGGS